MSKIAQSSANKFPIHPTPALKDPNFIALKDRAIELLTPAFEEIRVNLGLAAMELKFEGRLDTGHKIRFSIHPWNSGVGQTVQVIQIAEQTISGGDSDVE